MDITAPTPTTPAMTLYEIDPGPGDHEWARMSGTLVVYLQEDHELPFIGVSMRIRGGSVLVPESKTGMLGVYGNVWRSGGTKA
jgi:hypothetical protein